MKAIRIHNFGNVDELKVEETPRPKLGPNEVLVKIHDAGVNPLDWKIRAGQMKDWMPTQFPLTMGQDFSGEIVKVGENVKDFTPGDSVFGFASGSYAEYAAVSKQEIALMPESIDYEVAASLPTAGLTAFQIVVDVAQAAAEMTFLIHGAAGGVGSFAAQIALWKNARVIGTASAEDIGYLKQLGVEKVIDYRSQRFEEFVMNVDVVVDLVGGDTLERSYQIVKRGGLIITTVGGLNKDQIKKYGIRGVEFGMRPDAPELAKLAELVDHGILKPRLSRVLPLQEARTAQILNESGRSHGKIILHVM